MYLCLALVLTKQTLSLCVLRLVLSLIIDFVPVFIVFASLRNAFFSGGGARARENLLQPLALASLVARIPGFHPGYPGSIPGRRTKISLQASSHCCLSEINSSRKNESHPLIKTNKQKPL